jgi:hypothetical protein
MPALAKAAVIIPAALCLDSFAGEAASPDRGEAALQHVWERCRLAKGIEQVICRN